MGSTRAPGSTRAFRSRGAVAALVAIGLVVSGTAPAQAAVLPGLVASYDFSTTTGTTVPDASGNGFDATIKGSGVTIAGDAVMLPGGANNSGAGYVELPTGMFDGRDTVSVSMWVKNESAPGNYAAMFFGTRENLPSQYYLLNPSNPAGRVKSVITDGLAETTPWATESGISPSDPARGVPGPVASTGWSMHTTVITPTSLTAYVGDAKIATVPTTRTVSAFGTSLVAYLGRSSYPDQFFRGGIRDLSVYSTALTGADVTALFEAGAISDQDAVTTDAAALAIPNLADIRGNITLPTSGENGTAIAWSTSTPAVVTAGGEVTRPATGAAPVTVKLTAAVTRGEAFVKRIFDATVRPMPAPADYEGYFFPYFTGESSTSDEEVYFATSRGDDPQNWQTLNDARSVLQSSLGEEGIRDPFILRSSDGDRFFLLATDLNMADNYGGGDFGQAQESGSRNLVIWESDDLVTWSKERLVTVSSDLAGNTWAPEATWDAESGQYIVYWASNLYPDVNVGTRDFRASYNRMMYVTTRDFTTFSEPQPWVDVKRGEGRGTIDADVVRDGDTYYRFIKDEAGFDIRQEKSTDLDAVVSGALPTTTSSPGWQLVKEHIGAGQPNPWGGTFAQGEGPSAFRDNTDPDHWYLLIDQPTYHGGQGYLLFETHDIASGDWTSVPEAQLPGSARHGTVLPITAAEQQRLIAAYPSKTESDYTISLDESKVGAAIADTMYGIFFEDINWAADGGLYAELVRNRSFEFSPIDNRSYTGLTAWSTTSSGGGAGSVATVDDVARLNERNRTHLDVTLTNPAGGAFGVQNAGYNNGVAVKEGATYDFSVFARTTASGGTPLTVALQDAGGATISDTLSLTVSGDGWTKYTGTVTATRTTDAAKLTVLAGGTGLLRLDMVSLFPQDTFRDRENGLRKDLAEKIAALKPGFVRFPGGCIVNVNSHEGYDEASGYERARSYQWKDSIGPVETRATNANFWGYNQSLGLGYYEYFQFAEDIGAIPVPDVPALLNGCGQQLTPTDPALLQRHIQDTLDLIEFANGPVTSAWGKVRADMGHPAPFGLDRIEIGNEENYPEAFIANYVQFRDAIKAVYPEMILISNSGPDDEGASFDQHWEQNRAEGVDIVDEHYYNSPTWFLQNNARYDSYDRSGPKVWVGEYASLDNRLGNGLAEAAYMTGMERNADVVKMASYAPLLANVDNVQWTPDMIWFDNDETWGSANYEVQKLFMNNVGDRVVPTRSTGDVVTPAPITGSVGLSTWATSARYDDVTVTAPDGSPLFSDDFDDRNADGWSTLAPGGAWATSDGSYTQSSTTAENTLVAGPALTATDYDLSLKATKLAGSEGFLVGFGVKDSANYYWWNLGGFGNTRSLVEKATDGAKSALFTQEGQRIETGRTYDVRIEVRGTQVKLYLDGVLQGSFTDDDVVEPFAQVLTKDEATGDLILKVVNAQNVAARTAIDLGTTEVEPTASMTVITGPPNATNTRTAQPIAPVTTTIDGISSSFTRVFPANSITFIRMGAGEPADTTAPKVSVTTSPAEPDGTNGWYRSPVSVTASATDDGADEPELQLSRDGGLTWGPYTGAVELTDGSHSIAFRAIDAAGNISDPVDRMLRVDGTVPTAAATVDAAARAVTITAEDTGSGVAAVEYRIGSSGSWVTAPGATASVTLSGSQTRLDYRAVDEAGNTGATATATVPAPTGPRAIVQITSAGAPSAAGWYNQSVIVRITAPAGYTAQHRVDGGAWRTGNRSTVLSTNGVHSVDHRLLKSNAVVTGSAATVTVKIDRTAPVSTGSRTPAATGTPRNPVSLAFTATDTGSGVTRTEYRINSGDWTVALTAVPIVFSTVGDYVVSYRSVDEAGNVERTHSTPVRITTDVATTLRSTASTVHPGGYVTLSLAGFDRYDTVTLSVGATTFGTVFTDVTGAARITVPVPASMAPSVITVAAQGSDGEPTATARITVRK